jgi:hypothetical protein
LNPLSTQNIVYDLNLSRDLPDSEIGQSLNPWYQNVYTDWVNEGGWRVYGSWPSTPVIQIVECEDNPDCVFLHGAGWTCNATNQCEVPPICNNDNTCQFPTENYTNCPQDCCKPDCTACSASGNPAICPSDNKCHLTCDAYCGIVDAECDADTPNSCGNSTGNCTGCQYFDCGNEYWECCNSNCGRQYVNFTCLAGSCSQLPPVCLDCGSYICNIANGQCTSTCEEDCGAQCEIDATCVALVGPGSTCQAGCTCSPLAAICGNGVREGTEECDLGDYGFPEICQPYEKCNSTCQCYDFRPYTSGCEYYDYCDGSSPPCDWPDECYVEGASPEYQNHMILEVCNDTTKIAHNTRTCPYEPS